MEGVAPISGAARSVLAIPFAPPVADDASLGFDVDGNHVPVDQRRPARV